jgi:hypothetical protein
VPFILCPRQDSINGGKRGSKEMCLSAARSALAAGRSVIIDRTNIDTAQRQPFMQLARQCGAEVRRGGARHTVVATRGNPGVCNGVQG